MNLYLKVTDYSDVPVNSNIDLTLHANCDEIIDIFFIDEDDGAVDISDATVYFVVKNKPTDTDANAVLNLSYASSTFPSEAGGEASITLLDSTTAALLGNYIYQILIKFTGGTPIKVAAEGTICFQRDILTTPGGTGATAGPAPY